MDRLASLLDSRPTQGKEEPTDETNDWRPKITTVSIPFTSYDDDRPCYKLEDPASSHNDHVRRALRDSLKICYSETNRDNPSAARTQLSTLIDDINKEIDLERSYQILDGIIPSKASLIKIKLMPSLGQDADNPEGDLRGAPGESRDNPYSFSLSGGDVAQLEEGAADLRARMGMNLGETGGWGRSPSDQPCGDSTTRRVEKVHQD